MNGLSLPVLLGVAFALPLSILFACVLIALAQRRGWVAKPKADRWHQTPTALFGGVAIFAAFALCSLPLLPTLFSARRFDLIGLLAGCATIFTVGLLDDRKPLNPLVKMLGQVMAAMPFIVGMGLQYTSAAFIVSIPLITFWMVLLTNSFNLLDNMDGLSAGVALFVAALLGVYGVSSHQPLICAPAFLCAFSCLGFLCLNFPPKGSAKIFMGDCGSMFLGFLLAGLSVVSVSGAVTPPLTRFALPLLLMAIPLFDTTLVIIIRKREGRAISQGGKDHSSHRLVYAGCAEKRAVLALWGLTLLFGACAILLIGYNEILLLPLVLVAFFSLARLGVYLNRFAKPRPKSEAASLPAREPQISSSAPLRQE